MLSVIWKFLNLSSLPSQAGRVRKFGHCIHKAGELLPSGRDVRLWRRESYPANSHCRAGRLCATSESGSSSQSQLLRLKYRFFWSPPDSLLEVDIYKYFNVPGEAAIQRNPPKHLNTLRSFFLKPEMSLYLLCSFEFSLINLWHL